MSTKFESLPLGPSVAQHMPPVVPRKQGYDGTNTGG